MSIDSSDAHKAFLAGDGGSEGAPDTGSSADSAPAASTGGESVTQQAADVGNDAAQAASAAGAGAAQAAQAGARAAKDFMEGRLDGAPYQIPKGVHVPRTFKGQTVFEPLDKVIREHMYHQDYTTHKQRISAQESAFMERQRAFELTQRTVTERERRLNEEEQRFMDVAAGDPDSEDAQRYQLHLHNLRTNPDYKQKYQDSQQLHLRELEDTVHEEQEQQATASGLATDLASWIRETVCTAAKYQGKVDPEELRVAYGQAIRSEEIPFPDPQDPEFNDRVTRQVLRLADDMAARADRFIEPVNAQLAKEKAGREAAEAALAAGTANGEVRRQIKRSADARAAAPSGGAPPAQGGKSKTPRPPVMGGTHEARERLQGWVRGE